MGGTIRALPGGRLGCSEWIPMWTLVLWFCLLAHWPEVVVVQGEQGQGGEGGRGLSSLSSWFGFKCPPAWSNLCAVMRDPWDGSIGHTHPNGGSSQTGWGLLHSAPPTPHPPQSTEPLVPLHPFPQTNTPPPHTSKDISVTACRRANRVTRC